MSLRVSKPLILNLPSDLQGRFPHLGRAAKQLSLKYMYRMEKVTKAELRQMGQGLWNALDIEEPFTLAYEQAKPDVLPLVIRSSDPSLLTWPWECLYHPQEGFLGQNVGFTLVRQLANDSRLASPLPRGPLRVLLFISLPEGIDPETGRLDAEAEQACIL